jgi:hypothetical protein
MPAAEIMLPWMLYASLVYESALQYIEDRVFCIVGYSLSLRYNDIKSAELLISQQIF